MTHLDKHRIMSLFFHLSLCLFLTATYANYVEKNAQTWHSGYLSVDEIQPFLAEVNNLSIQNIRHINMLEYSMIKEVLTKWGNF
ncbi:hypothetical protein ABE28_012570 [Peribacillus muralis]|uniref:Uncharacterized protein n=1 Tax=Peribacillus muralis TaxID=264697 RepID=A0A1B3XPM9_9BACI|nr:hypothetical protein ABE28_012570 [Peribacillus muralis]